MRVSQSPVYTVSVFHLFKDERGRYEDIVYYFFGVVPPLLSLFSKVCSGF